MKMTEADKLAALCIEICPLRVGHRVTISPSNIYAGEWPGEYIITGMRWEYQRGDGHGINIAIASDEEIIGRYGDTDGWKVSDLIPAGRLALQSKDSQ